MPHTIRRFAVVTAGFALLLSGCKFVREKKLPETGATLEGKVTYAGEPVQVAMVIAQGEGGAATAFVGEGGRYRLENVPLGTVHLAVNTAAGKGDMMGKVMAKSQGKAPGSLPKAIDVPAKYANPTKSGITTTVNKGENTFDIVLSR